MQEVTDFIAYEAARNFKYDADNDPVLAEFRKENGLVPYQKTRLILIVYGKPEDCFLLHICPYPQRKGKKETRQRKL